LDKLFRMRRINPAVFLSMLAGLVFAARALGADKDAPPKPAQSVPELQQQIEKILQDTRTPGVSVAIVHRDGPEWVAGLGKADLASGRAATADTLFRIGSVSKAFASLAVLKLVREGKLSLNDTLHDRAPEIWFENRWEATDPIRVVHLLEHTTGWDDLRVRQIAVDAKGWTTRQGLDFDHETRISRWRPGTRMAYSNSGPAVAAYIVEKISGQRFEDYVEQNLFGPIGMNTATYFQPPADAATTLYHDDGKTPFPYENIIVRPSGAINASARDMAAYVQFYLNRGGVNGVQVTPSADIDRMESPESNWSAKAGLKFGYGLSNYWNIQDGFVYHGHNGGVQGDATEMAYIPEFDVGYFYSINGDQDDGYNGIGKAIRAYITRKLQRPPVPAAAQLPPNVANYAGWYEIDSPREEPTHFIDKLMGLMHVGVDGRRLLFTSLNTWKAPVVPVAGALFRGEGKKDPPDPVATLALLSPDEETLDDPGPYISLQGMLTLKRIPTWRALVEIGLIAFVVVSLASAVVYAPFWLLGGLSKRRRRPAERALRIWPLVAVLVLVTAGCLLLADDEEAIEHLGNLTVWSASLCAASILFAILSVTSLIPLARASKNGVRPAVRMHAALVVTALLIATAYLAYWGVIGVRTWL
jgi:CubicO group peptidase (beta-lactamase class C family)